jgi:hypothetical protein
VMAAVVIGSLILKGKMEIWAKRWK